MRSRARSWPSSPAPISIRRPSPNCFELLAAHAGALLVRAVGDASILVGHELEHDRVVNNGLGFPAGEIPVAHHHGRLEASNLGLLFGLIIVDAALRTRVCSALGTQTRPR